jgi:uncharacterized membrane protein YedE/YeeE
MAMSTLPLYMKDAFGYETGLFLVAVVGFAFGFVLERAGFGDARNIVSQFYVTDTRVLKVMFGAVTTACLGLATLSGFGVLDMSAVTAPPAFLLPAIVGGFLVGIGMVVSGYCPGTSVVAAASGNWDGVAAWLGMAVGSLLFGFAYPMVAGFYLSTPLETVLFPDILGIPFPVLAAGVAAMAMGAFLFGEWGERVVAKKNNAEPPESVPAIRNKVFAGLGTVAVLGLLSLPISGEAASEAAEKEALQLDGIELAHMVVADPASLHLVDIRPTATCKARTIPGAMCLPGDDPEGSFMAELPPTRKLVVFGDANTATPPAPAKLYGGPLYILAGGFPAFEQVALKAPAPPAKPTPESIERYRLEGALHAHFTGTRVKRAAVEVKPLKIKRKLKKGGGC